MSAADPPEPARAASTGSSGLPSAPYPSPYRSGRRWPTWARALLLGTASAATAIGALRVYQVDPAEPGHYPTCPFFALTGLDCPGCGTGRGLHQLLHGNVAAAADYNVVFVLLLPLLLGAWMFAVARVAGWRGRLPDAPGFLVKALPIAIVAFWVIRNLPLPGARWLAA